MGRPLEEAQLEKLARAILGVGAEQAKAELASGEIADTPAGEAFAIVLAQREALRTIEIQTRFAFPGYEETLWARINAIAAAAGGETETPPEQQE